MKPEQILDKYTTVIETEFGFSDEQLIQMMMEYATFCCEAQRKACAENALEDFKNKLLKSLIMNWTENGEMKFIDSEYEQNISSENLRNQLDKLTIDSILNTPITLL